MYGLLISLGAILAFFISERAVKKRGLELSVFYRSVNLAIILGLLGARAYHTIDYWGVYSKNPRLILQIWRGGMGIYGAIFGGFWGVLIGVGKKDLLKWLDVFVLGLPLAQSIGRWGNFFNKELYGQETSLPWGVNVGGKACHPLFLYESVLNFLLFLILCILEKRNEKLKRGTILGTYLLGYGLIRFFLEFLRVESWTAYGVNVAQAISLLAIIIPGQSWVWKVVKQSRYAGLP